MADLSKIGCDSIRLFHSGAGSAGNTQTDQSLSLGGFRSSSEIKTYDVTVTDAIANLTVDYASGNLPLGNNTKIQCTAADTVKLLVNNISGETVTLINGNTVQINMNNVGRPDQFIRLSRSGSMATGIAQISLATKLNNMLGMTNITSAQASAGRNVYRMLVLQNVSSDPISNLKIWLPRLGTNRISGASQLTSSGAGTIGISVGNFDDWPVNGWCRIERTDGTHRETVYYTSRTSTALTVPSAGRALLATTASAGASTDVLMSVPGIRIGLDDDADQAASWEFPTIANETTAPTSVSGYWASGTDDNDALEHALDVPLLATTEIIGIWIHKHLPAGTKASALSYTGLQFSFDGTSL